MTTAFSGAGAGGEKSLGSFLVARSDPLTDLGLILPIFVAYHIGVVFLPVRNAADFVTTELVDLANHSMTTYVAITVVTGALLAGVLAVLGRGSKLRWPRFALVITEGVVYALLMRIAAGYVVGSLRLGPAQLAHDRFAGVMMSLGAGLYEELAFRVVAFALGLRLLRAMTHKRSIWLPIVWALVTSLGFSAWHYVGALGDTFTLGSLVFRWVCGLALVTIFSFRGLAAAVWTHVCYDLGVLVF